jgi:hypothetical protein
VGALKTVLQTKIKDHHQDTKAPRKAKAITRALLGGLGVLVVKSPFL